MIEPPDPSKTIRAWAVCTGCENAYGGRVYDTIIKVQAQDTYSSIERGCSACQAVTTWMVGGQCYRERAAWARSD